MIKLFFVIIIFVFTFSIFGQENEKCACSKKDRTEIRRFFAELESQNKLIAECEVDLINQKRILIAGGCEWGGSGCPISIVKPKLSQMAKQLNIYGTVDVEVIVNEEGKVIYAKMIKGKKIFKLSAESATCKSLFRPFKYCDKTFKQKMIIRFNFIAS